jgi:ABC-type phosphate transport system substrate-binding protein
MTKFLFHAAMAVAAVALAQPTRAAETVTVKGSDTMVILGQKWAEVYMQRNPGTTIQVTGGGSGTGIAALVNGTTDIAESSRPMKPAEIASAESRQKAKVKEIRAVDLRELGEPAPGDEPAAGAQDLHRRGHELERGRRKR